MRWLEVGPAVAMSSLAVNRRFSPIFQRHLSENQAGIAVK
jgi:hypothetical protein